jgi:16S rRNA (guanine527-N7)-methyltransferase
MAVFGHGKSHKPRIERVIGEIAAKLGHDARLSDQMLERLALFFDRVVEWNTKTDLTAARDPDELADLLVADAALLSFYALAERWVDVGSGAGAPGLPLAILRPELEITLVDTKTKRVAFLRSVVGELGLSHVRVERTAGENLPRAAWHTAVSRATLPAHEWIALGTELATDHVWVFLAKQEAPAATGWTPSRDISYRWPLTGVERRALCFSRVV